MKKLFFIAATACLTACVPQQNNEEKMGNVSEQTIISTIKYIEKNTASDNRELIEKGVRNAAGFWIPADGTEDDFSGFCVESFAKTAEEKEKLFQTVQRNLEIIYGNYNKISLDLKVPLQIVGAEPTVMDEKFGAFDPYSHFSDDMFASKTAFSVLLNFPFFTLEEKNNLGKNWTRRQWAYARMGDLFNSRIPSAVNQAIADCATEADTYTSNYNIAMGNLRNEEGEQLFPSGMKLISHWGLRDELKSNYANADGKGIEKQEMIYTIMKRIVEQTIPQQVIDNEIYTWQPVSNRVKQGSSEIAVTPEPDTRYRKLYNIYKANTAADAYCPTYSTYLERSFDQAMEISDAEIETLFTSLMASEEVRKVAELIQKRLGRELRPFDIWYDGFKDRSGIDEEVLNVKTRSLYPNAEAVQKALPGLLQRLGFGKDGANAICSKIEVDASRGAGHAWGSQMRSDKAHLRTRIAPDGMDYKGYNIAVHEFGHNVEQTVSLHNVDNYVMNGVPSTAFTEALAFIFQVRDLQLLGYKADHAVQEQLLALDIFWGCYEIMGVSLVDLYTWRWLYKHPEATVEDIKNTIITNAQSIWNKYYAPILGEPNSPILAVYSHMIDIPLYLPNYPYGHLVEFQLEKQLKGKNIGDEILRIYPAGRLTPNLWMCHAVGEDVSAAPLLEATREALTFFD